MAQQLQAKKRTNSILKRQRQTEKKTGHNRWLKSTFRTQLKKSLLSFNAKTTTVKIDLGTIHSMIDKAHSKSIISKNAASRYKSKFSILTNKTP